MGHVSEEYRGCIGYMGLLGLWIYLPFGGSLLFVVGGGSGCGGYIGAVGYILGSDRHILNNIGYLRSCAAQKRA